MGAALEDLGGAGVLDRVEATLEFSERGGLPELDRAVDSSERSRSAGLDPIRSIGIDTDGVRHLKALQDAERFSLNGSVLLIFGKSTESFLSCVRSLPIARRAGRMSGREARRARSRAVGRRVAAGRTSTIIRSRWPRPAAPERAEPGSVLVGLARDFHRNSS